MKNKAIIIVGQTASGKTALAHKLFDELEKHNIFCEIVNLDAFQIYKNVSIGTAKPTESEQKQYKYHGIDVCEADGFMDANAFAEYAQNACREINARGNIPICVGGSGLYLRAFLHGLDSFPSHDAQVREKIRNYSKEHGWQKCHEWLASVDPVRAQALHPNDHVRVERALEIFEITQKPASSLQTKSAPLFEQGTNLDSFIIHTEIKKEDLKKNIHTRTKELFKQGWMNEVSALYEKYGEQLLNFNSMRAIGYKNILDFIKKSGSQNLDEHATEALITQIVQSTCQYAKRQKTWNKKEKIDFVYHSAIYW